MKFIEANEIVLHYQDEGNPDGTPLVFVNSLGTDFRTWDDVVPHFATDYRIIRHDKRGHGSSDCPPPPYTIRDHAMDLAALLDALNVEQAILVGISVGGMIALDFAAQHLDRVHRLVLCDTAPKIGTQETWNERIDTLRTHGMAYLGNAIIARWFAPDFVQERSVQSRGYYNMLTRIPVDGYIGTCEALRDADLWPHVETITVPTLVLCGAEDVATAPEMAQQLAAALSNATCELIVGAGHLPCIEKPDVMAQKIAAFLKDQAK